MQKLSIFDYVKTDILEAIVIIFILSLSSACEKTEYDLLDTESAGVWKLYNTTTGLPSNQIKDIELDDSGNLWVAFSANGVGKLEDDSWSFYVSANSPIVNNSVTSLESGRNGSMIIGTENGLSYISATGQWSSYKDPLLATMQINCIRTISNGTTWIGTQDQGYYLDDGSDYTQVRVTPFTNINAIEGDSRGNVFLGTDIGLLKWDGSAMTTYTTANGLPDNDVRALFYDSSDKLWIGTSVGQTVSYLDDMGFHRVSLMNSTPGTTVEDIHEDENGDIWFATRLGGLIRYDGVISHSYKVYNGFFENDVTCISEDADGNLWFGLYSKGLVKYTLPIK